MAIQWMDNFRAYGKSSQGSRISDGTYWDSPYEIVNDPDPNAEAGSVCLDFRHVYSAESTNFVVPTPRTRVGYAQRIWFYTLPGATEATLFSFCRVGHGGNYTNSIYRLGVRTNGSLFIAKGDTVLAQTSGPVVLTNRWMHFEMMVDTVTGEIEVRHEGIPIQGLTVADPEPDSSFVAHLYWSHGANAKTFLIKDFIVWDGTGDINTSFMGPVTIYDCPPDGDVSSGWTRSSGSEDYSLVNENGPPNDTTYIYAGEGPLPASSIMTLKDLPEDVVSIRGIMTLARARKVDGGDGSIQVNMVSGADKDEGTDRPITTAFSYWHDISEKNPTSGFAWTPYEFNNANIEVDRTK